jgi:arylamine N-acetyltransferase
MTKPSADVAAYFARIDYAGPIDPTLETLAGLVAAHGRWIPFENLDPLLGVPVTDLSPRALIDKLVTRRRGGFCYEHSNLLRYVLEHLGFGVDALTARVVWMSPHGLDGPPTAETHQALAVRIPDVDDPFLVDVGFGGQALTSPIHLTAGPIQRTRHEPYRLRAYHQGYVLEALVRDIWQPLYTFTTDPRPLVDLQVGSWYASTHPESRFITGLTVTLVTDDARWNLRGHNLTVHTTCAGTERTRFDTAAQVIEVLTKQFGIDLSSFGDIEARVSEVLES